jgi:hypothetical protein
MSASQVFQLSTIFIRPILLAIVLLLLIGMPLLIGLLIKV